VISDWSIVIIIDKKSDCLPQQMKDKMWIEILKCWG
jgi:hypothetical protein